MRKACVAWMDPPLADLFDAYVPELIRADSRRDFYQAIATPCRAIFVDGNHLPETGAVGTTIPVVAVISDGLSQAVNWLDDFPWISHVISEGTLADPSASMRISALVYTLTAQGRPPSLASFLGAAPCGRSARVVDAARRGMRLDRMARFFEYAGAGTRTVGVLRDVAEELLTNALYDAPVAAGFLPHPVPRSEEVAFTPDRACDITYGVASDGLSFISVRDTFGSLTRRRLVDVLKRCARTGMDVEIDSSMGGAGLGLWRIFSQASFVALSVVPGVSTEFVVGVARRARTMTINARSPRAFAFHLYFNDETRAPAWADLRRGPLHDSELERSATFQPI